jgi:hypothetical protein
MERWFCLAAQAYVQLLRGQKLELHVRLHITAAARGCRALLPFRAAVHSGFPWHHSANRAAAAPQRPLCV